MSYNESFYRGAPVAAEARLLPAEQYNAMRLLLDFSGQPCVFVPIRSMQYLAVIDAEEVIFVDSMRRREIEFSWRRFRPQTRQSLSDPVPYLFEYYQRQAPDTCKRAQGEFFGHVLQLAKRMRQRDPAISGKRKILPFPPADR
jgi:hypothetical protein